MIEIINAQLGSIDYTCDCGVVGECIFKPRPGNLAMVLQIECPMCEDTKRIKFIQYENDEDRERLTADDVDYHWPIVIDNNIRN